MLCRFFNFPAMFIQKPHWMLSVHRYMTWFWSMLPVSSFLNSFGVDWTPCLTLTIPSGIEVVLDASVSSNGPEHPGTLVSHMATHANDAAHVVCFKHAHCADAVLYNLNLRTVPMQCSKVCRKMLYIQTCTPNSMSCKSDYLCASTRFSFCSSQHVVSAVQSSTHAPSASCMTTFASYVVSAFLIMASAFFNVQWCYSNKLHQVTVSWACSTGYKNCLLS